MKSRLQAVLLAGGVLASPSGGADFNISAPDENQRGLLFVLQAPASTVVGAENDPFTVGGGTQTLDFTFDGAANQLQGTLRGAALSAELQIAGNLNEVRFETLDGGLVASELGLRASGDLNTFTLTQERVLEIRELDLDYTVVGSSNTIAVSPSDGTLSEWSVDGVGNAFSDTLVDSLDVFDTLFWQGSNGLLTRSATFSDGLEQIVTVVGDENVLAFDYASALDSSVTVDVAGLGNALTLSLDDVVGAVVDLRVLGDRNSVVTLSRSTRNAVIRLRLNGSGNEVTIRQLGP